MGYCVSKFDQVGESLQPIVELFTTPYSKLREAFERQHPSTASSDCVLVEEILSHFKTLNAEIELPSKVRSYLYRYPEIAELARNVSDLVYQYFDFKAQLSIEVRDDGDQDSEYLIFYIRVPEYDDNVMGRIREIRERYYDSLNEVAGWFLLTTDFAAPR
jgi:hypothetical protein